MTCHTRSFSFNPAVGDLILCRGHYEDTTGVFLKDNQEGGTVKIYDAQQQKSYWVVRSYCEVISKGDKIKER